MLCEKYDVIVNMLRSTSFLIMENAAVLLHVLIKNRVHIAILLQESALSECLALKHLYNAMYSPSSAQRFISRFLVSNWLSGDEASDGKMLLRRILPSGLIEYLKYDTIGEKESSVLDVIEEEFYAMQYHVGVSTATKNPLMKIHERMKRRLLIAQRGIVNSTTLATSFTTSGSMNLTSMFSSRSESPTSRDRKSSVADKTTIKNNNSNSNSNSKSIEASGATEGSGVSSTSTFAAIVTNTSKTDVPKSTSTLKQENFRIMFHAMTQNHELPDLIWNDRTRHELRCALESEINSFEREQRLRGLGNVAWNYQHFYVSYESLKDELQVGPIYVKYFLSAGDSFLRTLENPSHTILFEQLIRRVLVFVDHNSKLAVLCGRCLTRLYNICGDKIGEFKDIILIIRIIEQTLDMELQHVLLDLLEELCRVENNLKQLLDKEFISLMMKFCSFAHLNPNQIGNILSSSGSNQTTSILLLTDYRQPMNPTDTTGRTLSNKENIVDASGKYPSNSSDSETVLKNQRRKSLWLPNDSTCPKLWFVASTHLLPPPVTSQRGPFRICELADMLQGGTLEPTWLLAPAITKDTEDEQIETIVDTGRWRKLSEHFQLRVQLLFQGNAIYEPAEISMKALNIIFNLSNLHKSTNIRGVLFHPTPISKRLVSEQEYLSIFAQLLLCNNSNVVDIAAKLVQSLVQYNDIVCSKLYLTGLFFFACRYSGNNFDLISSLLHMTHLRQSFHENISRPLTISEKSALGCMLPTALLNILENYGPERFSEVFCGDYDTPEIIWNASLRKHTVDMINQHLGDLSLRLKQNTMERYEYCPIPRIRYVQLEKELYCHDYYLRNLCNETKYSNWNISNPLLLLKDVIECWKIEMAKEIEDKSVKDAKILLGLSDNYDPNELRKSYKLMARKYHPDKNPNGSEMFEKIYLAYELLSSIENNIMSTDVSNIILILKTQILLYSRFPDILNTQRYSAYEILLTHIVLPPELDNDLSHDILITNNDKFSTDKNTSLLLISKGILLIYYTLKVSPSNSNEFVRVNGVPALLKVYYYSLSIMEKGSLNFDFHQILIYCSKSLAIISSFESGRESIKLSCPDYALSVYSILGLSKVVPLAVEYCLISISNCAADTDLQNIFVSAGVIWKLIPLLLSFDGTLKEADTVGDEKDESMRMQYNQHVANMHAVLSARALGRLAGVMFEELASPPNLYVRNALGRLLTPPLSKLLRNRQPWELLKALNENVEKPTKIWNVSLRTELLSFVRSVDQRHSPGLADDSLAPCNDFLFSSLKNELFIGGVYLRLFVASKDVKDIEDPSAFCLALLDYINEFLHYTGSSEKRPPPYHQELAVESLQILIHRTAYVARDVSQSAIGLSAIFDLLSVAPDSPLLFPGVSILKTLLGASEFINVLVIHTQFITTLLRTVCSSAMPAPALVMLWEAVEAISVNTEGLQALISVSAVPLLLGLVFNVPGFQSTFQNRQSALSLLGKFLWNPAKGSLAGAVLRR